MKPSDKTRNSDTPARPSLVLFYSILFVRHPTSYSTKNWGNAGLRKYLTGFFEFGT